MYYLSLVLLYMYKAFALRLYSLTVVYTLLTRLSCTYIMRQRKIVACGRANPYTGVSVWRVRTGQEPYHIQVAFLANIFIHVIRILVLYQWWAMAQLADCIYLLWSHSEAEVPMIHLSLQSHPMAGPCQPQRRWEDGAASRAGQSGLWAVLSVTWISHVSAHLAKCSAQQKYPR